MNSCDTQRDERLNDIREMWAQQDDDWIVKAALEDIEEYDPVVQQIIHEEALKRRLIAGINPEVRGAEERAAITEKGIEILATAKGESPSFFVRSALLAYGTLVIVGGGLITVGYLLGLPERVVIMGGSVICLGCWVKIKAYRKKRIQSKLQHRYKESSQ